MIVLCGSTERNVSLVVKFEIVGLFLTKLDNDFVVYLVRVHFLKHFGLGALL